MLKQFKQRGVPIDGVGLQMHIFEFDFDASAVAANIARLAALGSQVHVTEFDVALPLDSSGKVRTEDLNRQADIYRSVVRVCMQNTNCTAIQTWGFTDKYSWIGSHSRRTRGFALPFDRSYKPKPAYHAMLAELASGRKPVH
jgi:endo-1,4-beta-xylanase